MGQAGFRLAGRTPVRPAEQSKEGVSPGHFGQSHGRDRFDHGRIKEVAPLDGETGDVVFEQGEGQEAEGADEPEFEVDEEEAHSAGVQRTPVLPSQNEIDEHNLTHLPFRDWCPFCIRGRGLSSGHFARKTPEESQVPTISIDYCFLGDETTRDTDLPVLVVRDRRTKSVWAHPVPAKGVENPFGAKQLLKDIESTGYKRVNLKGDQEASIRAIMQQAKNGFQGECIIEEAPVEGHAKSNGEAERAIQMVQGMARTLKEFVEYYAEVEFKADHPALTWLVEHAATLLTLFHKGAPKDGMTAYQRLKGKTWRVPLPSWGELVEFRLRGNSKMGARWQPGIFVGVNRNTTEKAVATPEGIHWVVSLRRKPELARWDGALLKKVKGVPWDLAGGNSGSWLDRPLSLRAEVPEVEVREPEPFRLEPGTRNLYITQKNLEKYGYTAGCPACESAQRGKRKPGIAHSHGCRVRIEAAAASDPAEKERYDRALMKAAEAAARKDNVQEPADEPKELKSRRVASEAAAPPLPEFEEPAPRLAETGRAMPAGVASTPAQASGSASSKRAAASDQALDERSPTRRRSGEERNPKRKHEGNGEEELEASQDARVVDAELSINSLIENHHDECVCALVHEIEKSGQERVVCEEPDFFEAYLDEFYDDISGRELEPEKVVKARKEEVDFIRKMGVWQEVDRPSDKPVLKGRWVDINKGDEDHPIYRSRYVGKEIKKGSKGALVADFFAAMPPLSSFKLLLTLAMTDRFYGADGTLRPRTEPWYIMFIDVKRAHFVAEATRDLYVELPGEIRRPGEDKVGKLLKSLYGTRDAASNWEKTIRKVMESFGFLCSMGTPCNFYHPTRNLRCTVHGDDFVTLGPMSELKKLAQEMRSKWMIEERGIFGPPESSRSGTVQKMRHLNRILRWTAEGIIYETDPRHVDLVVKALGVTKPVTTPLVRESPVPDDQEVEDKKLSEEEATLYRSCTMRIGYIAQDRTDLQRATRELAKGMSSPTERHMEMLKRCARYLVHSPRLLQVFKRQKILTRLDVYSDSDHAGCLRTRKSTSGCVVMAGCNQLRSICRGQAVVALSSGEAEFYALVTSASEALGEQAIAREWSVRLDITLWFDATAGAAMSSRRGLGRVKHIHTAFLWIQSYVTNGVIKLGKKHTSQNLADILTKPVTSALMTRMMDLMGFKVVSGRSSIAFAV